MFHDKSRILGLVQEEILVIIGTVEVFCAQQVPAISRWLCRVGTTVGKCTLERSSRFGGGTNTDETGALQKVQVVGLVRTRNVEKGTTIVTGAVEDASERSCLAYSFMPPD